MSLSYFIERLIYCEVKCCCNGCTLKGSSNRFIASNSLDLVFGESCQVSWLITYCTLTGRYIQIHIPPNSWSYLWRSDDFWFKFSHRYTLNHNKTWYSNGWTLALGQHTCRRADSNTFFLLPAPTQACHQECQLALIRRRCAGSRQLHCARLSQPPPPPATGRSVLLSFPHKVKPRRILGEDDVRPPVWTWEVTRQAFQGQVFFVLEEYIWRL